MLPSVVAWFVRTTAILVQQILMLPACPSKLTQVYIRPYSLVPRGYKDILGSGNEANVFTDTETLLSTNFAVCMHAGMAVMEITHIEICTTDIKLI